MKINSVASLLLIAGFLVTNCFTNQSGLSNSVSDLSKIQWEKQIPINLSEDWDFYWMQLVDPRDFQSDSMKTKPDSVVAFRPWTNQKLRTEFLPAKGYATYRKRIPVQSGTEELHFSIFFGHPFSASRLYVNGRLLQEVGKVSQNLDEMIPLRLNTLVEFSTQEKNIDLVIQISNRDFFRGGPRGQFLLASPKRMQLYQLQSYGIEILIFGLIFGAFIYHLAFYILNRNHLVFLFFSLLCLSFLIRFPFLNSKLYIFAIPVLPFDGLTNMMHYINIFSLLTANKFLTLLFSRKKVPYLSEFFYLTGAFAFLSPFFPGYWKYYFNLYYVIIFVILFFLHSVILLIRHKEEKQFNYLMGIGLFGLSVFSFVAIFLNLYGVSGGIYLIAGYAVYVVFQSISLSKYFAYAIESRASIELQMQEENLKALSKQRSEMQLMVHDNLGAGLTDLKILLERETRVVKGAYKSFLYGLQSRLDTILGSLRSNLLEIEDLNMLYENFLTGLKLTLLRRYSEIGREINLELTESAEQHFQNLKMTPRNRDFYTHLYYIFYEVCTNDLKHGAGESHWNLSIRKTEFLFTQSNTCGKKKAKENPMLKSISLRISRLHGRVTTSVQDSQFILSIVIPFGE